MHGCAAILTDDLAILVALVLFYLGLLPFLLLFFYIGINAHASLTLFSVVLVVRVLLASFHGRAVPPTDDVAVFVSLIFAGLLLLGSFFLCFLFHLFLHLKLLLYIKDGDVLWQTTYVLLVSELMGDFAVRALQPFPIIIVELLEAILAKGVPAGQV